MLAVTCCAPLPVPLITVPMSTMTVSLGSSSASCTAVSVIDPLRLPARIVMLVPDRVKSLVSVAVPANARFTVTAWPETADNVAVTIATPAASAIGLPEIPNVTVGSASSSVMPTVTCCTPLSVPLTTVPRSTMTVSLGSSSASCKAVNVTDPLRLPAGIVMLVPDRV